MAMFSEQLFELILNLGDEWKYANLRQMKLM